MKAMLFALRLNELSGVGRLYYGCLAFTATS